jgi:hypothetical protein
MGTIAVSNENAVAEWAHSPENASWKYGRIKPKSAIKELKWGSNLHKLAG